MTDSQISKKISLQWRIQGGLIGVGGGGATGVTVPLIENSLLFSYVRRPLHIMSYRKDGIPYQGECIS